MYFSNSVRRKKLRLALLFGSLLLALGARTVLRRLRFYDLEKLTEVDKCPACYGKSLCDSFTENRVALKHGSLYASFANLFGTKNVYFGTYDEREVVFKKLASTPELRAFDEMICTDERFVRLCRETDSNERKESREMDYLGYIARELSINMTSEKTSSLGLCPSTNRMGDLFTNIYLENADNGRDATNARIWTLLKINPEPLVLQIFPAKDGWPVPKYFGSCGRLVVEEYVGPPLTDYYEEPWMRRAKIASSLLTAARSFTYSSEEFGIYLTDVSPDNIAVNDRDEARFVDMENVIVVDKRIPLENRSFEWNELESNDVRIDCIDCFAFSPVDICARRHSDHNYYAVCHLLAPNERSSFFSKGLLHDVPNIVLARYPDLPSLLATCVEPSASRTRVTAGDSLREILTAVSSENLATNPTGTTL